MFLCGVDSGDKGRKMGNANAFCEYCGRATWHRQRKSGVPFYVSVLSLGMLRTKYYKCEVCENRTRSPRMIDVPEPNRAELDASESIESEEEDSSGSLTVA